MKKLLLTTILVATLTQLQAQISFGVKAGLNAANIIDKTNYPNTPFNTPSMEGDIKFAYHIGLISNYELSDKVSVSTELLLSNKGSKDGNFKLALLYLNLPILMNYHFTDKLSIHAGPELGVKLSSQIKGNNSSADVSDFYDQSFDLGASLGLTYQATDKFHLTLRYTRGLLTVIDGIYYTDDGSGAYKQDTRVYNNNFQLSLSYLFLKK